MLYTLPPLPPFGYYETNPHGPDELYPPVAFTADQMQEHDRAAIEAERIAALEADKEALIEALAQELQTRLCRLIHSEGDAGRNALAKDGGAIARIAIRNALHEKASDAN